MQLCEANNIFFSDINYQIQLLNDLKLHKDLKLQNDLPNFS